MQFRPISFISSLLATVLTAAILVVGAPTASNAEGVAYYLYKCDPPSAQPAFTISPGTSLTVCDNATIRVYHNGYQVDHYQTDAAGIQARNLLTNRQTAECLVAIAGGIGGVLTSGGIYMRITNAALGAWGLSACKA